MQYIMFEQMQEGSASFSEEELKELNEMISEFGEEELNRYFVDIQEKYLQKPRIWEVYF